MIAPLISRDERCNGINSGEGCRGDGLPTRGGRAHSLYPLNGIRNGWDEITIILSRAAVRKGAFAKFAGLNKAKRGPADIDQEFRWTTEGWRVDLAANLALRKSDRLPFGNACVAFAVYKCFNR